MPNSDSLRSRPNRNGNQTVHRKCHTDPDNKLTTRLTEREIALIKGLPTGRHVVLDVSKSRGAFPASIANGPKSGCKCDLLPPFCTRCGESGHYRRQCYTWKTTWCELDHPHDPTKCDFAHYGCEHLRRPRDTKCVRVVHNHIVLGCGSDQHTYSNCPHAAAELKRRFGSDVLPRDAR